MLLKRLDELVVDRIFNVFRHLLAGRAQDGARGLGKQLDLVFVFLSEIDEVVLQEPFDAVAAPEDLPYLFMLAGLDDGPV